MEKVTEQESTTGPFIQAKVLQFDILNQPGHQRLVLVDKALLELKAHKDTLLEAGARFRLACRFAVALAERNPREQPAHLFSGNLAVRATFYNYASIRVPGVLDSLCASFEDVEILSSSDATCNLPQASRLHVPVLAIDQAELL